MSKKKIHISHNLEINSKKEKKSAVEIEKTK